MKVIGCCGLLKIWNCFKRMGGMMNYFKFLMKSCLWMGDWVNNYIILFIICEIVFFVFGLELVMFVWVFIII